MQSIWFPTTEEYTLDEECPRCGAQPNEPCTIRPHGRGYNVFTGCEVDTGARYHAPRIDRGLNHYDRDVGKAPWLEDRVFGTNYGTLKHSRKRVKRA